MDGVERKDMRMLVRKSDIDLGLHNRMHAPGHGVYIEGIFHLLEWVTVSLASLIYFSPGTDVGHSILSMGLDS